MRSLIEKLFKRNSELDYVIAEYKPSYSEVIKNRVKLTEYDDDLLDEKDEMAIDNLYQRN
jgi:hypothetical protein